MGLIFGNERTGLTQAEIECCDLVHGRSHSGQRLVDLSLAASLVMYEFAKPTITECLCQ